MPGHSEDLRTREPRECVMIAAPWRGLAWRAAWPTLSPHRNDDAVGVALTTA
jgi:hypothetical protein